MHFQRQRAMGINLIKRRLSLKIILYQLLVVRGILITSNKRVTQDIPEAKMFNLKQIRQQ